MSQAEENLARFPAIQNHQEPPREKKMAKGLFIGGGGDNPASNDHPEES